MRPRMYGSSESHRFLTSTSPCAGSGSGAFSVLKLSSETQPWGRLVRTIRRFSFTTLNFARRALERGEAGEMVVGVAELAGDDGQAPKRVTDLQLLAHAHAAVELHRFLA